MDIYKKKEYRFLWHLIGTLRNKGRGMNHGGCETYCKGTKN